MNRTEAMKAIARVLAQPTEDAPKADMIGGFADRYFQDATPRPTPWVMAVNALAMRIAAQLPFGDAAPQSPLAQAEDAKRRRDLDGELTALMQGGISLASAPWYPARPGDLVHVHYEAGGLSDAFGETYLIAAGDGGFLSMQLLAHTLPETKDTAGLVGCFAVEDDPDPLTELWMEAGPHRLTIVRDGQAVHDGPSGSLGAAARGEAPTAAQDLAAAVHDAERYLSAREPELALARLQSHKPLPPCGAPGFTAEQADCARPRGHRGACSDDPDYINPPHECPALPEQLHAVVTVGAKVSDVSIEGLYEERDAAVDHASGFDSYSEELNGRHVTPMPHGGTVVQLPQAKDAFGVQLAVVIPLPVLPDPRAADEWAAEGMATALGPEDYDDDYRDDE
ncbi:hypothetical protein ABZX77_48705 [Streptomyces sp. NPDC004237]|uniref:hypothetical protein n=1 Tax=Streptomyces sp. NPDC004237 TaxID=3154455 RepID=UPI0033AD3344